ncbi:MAG TPA: hypothetical protein VGI70_00325, partial [Polyangiales bacterium]
MRLRILFGCLLASTACGKGDKSSVDAGRDASMLSAGHAGSSESIGGHTGTSGAGGHAAAGQAGTSTRDAGVHDAAVPKDSGSLADAMTRDAKVDANDAGPVDAGDKPAACSGEFCEDFETGSLDPAVWTKTSVSGSSNSVKVQSAMKAHGQYAAQFHAKGGSQLAMMFLQKLPSDLQKHYFGRLYYYASDFPTESGGHTAYITSSNTLQNFPDSDHHLEVASYATNAGAIWQMTYWTGDGPEYIGSGGQIPKAKWFCLEWEFNDSPDQIAIWVDGDGTTQG